MTDERWTPVRYVAKAVACDFCWETIPRAKPGVRVGERGTKAWYNPDRRVFECLKCHDELTRVQLARR